MTQPYLFGQVTEKMLRNKICRGDGLSSPARLVLFNIEFILNLIFALKRARTSRRPYIYFDEHTFYDTTIYFKLHADD